MSVATLMVRTLLFNCFVQKLLFKGICCGVLEGNFVIMQWARAGRVGRWVGFGCRKRRGRRQDGQEGGAQGGEGDYC